MTESSIADKAPKLGILNPMWDELADFVGLTGRPFGGTELVIGGYPELVPARRMSADDEPLRFYLAAAEEREKAPLTEAHRAVFEQASWLVRRQEVVRRYSWTVPDPWTVQFVQRWAGGRLIDPLAGTGYWGYLLHQLGVDVALFDQNPPVPGSVDNVWHTHADQWMDVQEMDVTDSVIQHSEDRVLLLSWPPPHSDAGFRALRAYMGDTVIYLGEGAASCGDKKLWDWLDSHWTEVDAHRPVRFYGMRDLAFAYRRTDAEPDDKEGERSNDMGE